MSDMTLTKNHEVAVICGGQAGLAIGYQLAKQGRDFTILEAASEPAAAWRERWDSLRLSWQHTRGSALLGWVKDDAEYIAHQIGAFRAVPAGERALVTN